MVLMVMTLATSVFLWTLYQNTLYNNAVKAQNQQELDARNENVVANGNYTVSGGKVSVVANLTNAGPVTAQIVSLWVFDTSKQTYGFNNSIANKPWANLTWTTLKAGQVLKFTSGNATKVTVPNAASLDNFNIWFVTARGNTVPLAQSQSIIIAQVSQGIGSVAMDFNSFIYYHVDQPSPGNYRLRQSEWPTGLPGFLVPNVNIAFRVTLTNFDPQKRSITLGAHSALWMIFKTNNPQQPRSMWWQIVNVNATGWITSKTPATFSNVSLPYASSYQVYFASANDLSSDNFLPTSPSQTATPGAVNLMLFGTIGTSTYAQNIPFVSVYVQ
jgi:hypothetical protein